MEKEHIIAFVVNDHGVLALCVIAVFLIINSLLNSWRVYLEKRVNKVLRERIELLEKDISYLD